MHVATTPPRCSDDKLTDMTGGAKGDKAADKAKEKVQAKSSSASNTAEAKKGMAADAKSMSTSARQSSR